MTRTVVIGERGPRLTALTEALGNTRGIEIAGQLALRRPIAQRLAPLGPELTIVQEPAYTPLPPAVIREARHAAPFAALIVLAADATPDWVADAINGGATAVLPSTVDAASIGRVAVHIVTEHDAAFEALRLRWAA